jgi:hypothetical protein
VSFAVKQQNNTDTSTNRQPEGAALSSGPIPASETPRDIVRILNLGPHDRPDLRRIGYWRALEHAGDPIPEHAYVIGMAPLQADGGYTGERADAFMRLPWPGDHLDPNMPTDLRKRVCEALESAPIVARYCGNARSRLQPMGSCGGCERSNGAWVWPNGLVHYVADHGLVLCDDFLRSLGIIRGDGEGTP